MCEQLRRAPLDVEIVDHVRRLVMIGHVEVVADEFEPRYQCVHCKLCGRIVWLVSGGANLENSSELVRELALPCVKQHIGLVWLDERGSHALPDGAARPSLARNQDGHRCAARRRAGAVNHVLAPDSGVCDLD